MTAMVYETQPPRPARRAGLQAATHQLLAPPPYRSARRAGSRTSGFCEDASGSEQIALSQGGLEGPL